MATRYAYADPPYMGCCRLYDHQHMGYGCWDEIETHAHLIAKLYRDFPEGWALSATSVSLRAILPYCPDTRVAAWVKPFAVFKPGVNPGYCWEPVILYGGRKRTDRTEPTVRDFLSENITLKKGLAGAKPPRFNQWILDLLGYQEGDELVDLFPGTGGMGDVIAQGQLAV